MSVTMAEEVNYASVVFKTGIHPPAEARKEDEAVYAQVKARCQTSERTADANGPLSDKELNRGRHRYQQVACCLGILCVILLLGIVAVAVYHATSSHWSEQNQLKENQTILVDVTCNKLSSENENLRRDNTNLTSQNQQLERQNQNLTSQNQNLTSQNQNLTSQNQNLTSQNQNLTSQNQNLTSQNQNLTSQNQNLTSQNQNLTSQNQNLTSQNQNLTSQNQQLKVVMNNLTEQIQSMETKWNELNVSRAQWSIDAFCPKNKNRTCQPCQEGWLNFQSSCYAINNPEPSGQKTWEEARENCRGKISDLAVVTKQQDKSFISNNSWSSSGINGYWIGLRAEDGRWKWVDESNLTESSWIEQPPVSGMCAVSVQNQGWRPVSCGDKNGWICWKKALSV